MSWFLCKLRQRGAILLDNFEINNLEAISNSIANGETLAILAAEFKQALNAYLQELVTSPVRSLADVIAFNKKFPELVSILESISSVYVSLVRT